ncbi:hypothetical protein COB21_02990 [Candidatus Aerophobetes bacterium]|uniref:Uncharacterized protein n=1 Tax=Aerophobetes bacterium TaxID=2030807 RepID=A0A2A4X4Q5_UNCAE|nr:MAG: hypothetical protein COB21_02990 [Candidatus Aerophobetes bacterium]
MVEEKSCLSLRKFSIGGTQYPWFIFKLIGYQKHIVFDSSRTLRTDRGEVFSYFLLSFSKKKQPFFGKLLTSFFIPPLKKTTLLFEKN